jgi:hypothetical protein
MKGMSRNSGRRLALFALALFAVVVLGIDFFHTEGHHGQQSPSDCPACHFHNSSVSVSPVACFALPALTCRRLPVTQEPCRLAEVPVLALSSRAPPQA